MDLVATASLCQECLTPGHGATVRTCPFRRELKGLCAKLKCKQSHHQLLHMEGKPELRSYHRAGRSTDAPNKHPMHIVAATAHLAGQPPAQLVTQRIRTAAGEPCITFWDTGSQVTLMTHGAAKGLGLKPIPGPPLNLMGVENGQRTRSTVRYKVPLVDTGGRTVEVAAYGMSHIMDSLEEADLRLMRAVFPEAPTGGIEAIEGKVDLLMGQDNFRLFPVEHRRVEDAALYRSRFGTGWIASGVPPGPRSPSSVGGTVVSAGVTASAEVTSCAGGTGAGGTGAGLTGREELADVAEPAGNARLSESRDVPDEGTGRAGQLTSSNKAAPPEHRENGIFQPSDFLMAEALGTDMPHRCKNCLKCKECQFRADSLSFKENQEYQVILDGLKFDEKQRKWTASYPFCIPPSKLGNNYDQVYELTLLQEKRLAKQGRTEEFNKQFYETVGRGVFRELSPEEVEEWKGPVNYITMVEAFKEGPHSTTPLRICMNSSLRQPRPVSLALNDCLMKGPPALVDLFTVTVGVCEHRYALTKDLSKFYPRVGADPLAQHLRRVMWRGGDGSAEMKVYITTTVNFGDKPAGCIAIAVARETADRFGAEFPEAAWFLKFRTYVDDATAGADTMARLRELSSEM
jgi:hypothetical protein